MLASLPLPSLWRRIPLPSAYPRLSILRPACYRIPTGSRFQSSPAQPENTSPSPQMSVEAPQVRVSSCAQGTILTGINIYKDGKDPVAMADHEYPAWLWKLTDPITDPDQQLSVKQRVKQARKRFIKEQNLASKK